MAVAATLGGAAGFGTSLMSTPLLLLLGFPLSFVVTLNLAMNMVTRVAASIHLRRHITRRSTWLIIGSVPGLIVGVLVVSRISEHLIKLGTGVVVLVLTLFLARAISAPAPRPLRGAPVVAGMAGGFLGATTSLNGMPAVLLLARDKVAPASFLADLAFYFVVSNALALAILRLSHAMNTRALFPALLVWLPGSIIGNQIGIALGTRLPERVFRWFIIVVAFIAGVITIATA
ncbi:MAG TPA: sulfite exporter TauE/SafE family protein [Nitrolancea sp.]|nr:sulfite exporter TauE/SafE family protein [Nitrolancea sp.]